MKRIAAIVLFLFPLVAFGGHVLIRQNQNQLNLTQHSSFYRDKTGNLTFEQIKNLAFQKIDKSLSNTSDIIWIKIDLKNFNHEYSDWVLLYSNQYIEYVDFYIETHEKGKFEKKSLGRFRERQYLRLAEFEPFVNFNLEKSSSKTIYLKIKSNIITHTNLELHTLDSYNKLYYRGLLIKGILLGLVFLRLLYVLILGFFVVKDRVFKRYSFLLILRSLTFLGLQSFFGVVVFSNPIHAGIANFVAYHITPIGLVLVLEVLLPIKNWNIFTRYFPKSIIIINLILLPFIIFDHQRIWILVSFYLYIFTQSTIILFFVYAIIKKTKFDINYAIPYLLGLTTFFLSQLSLIGFKFNGTDQFATFAFVLEIFIFGLFLGRIILNSEKANAQTQTKLDFSRQYSSKLEELDKLKTRFFTNISHEFRTPLTLLVGPIDDLKQKYPQEGIIVVMQRNLQRLQTLINQLLDISKLEAGEMTIHRQETDLARFLNQLFASFESLAQSKHITFNHSQSHTKLLGLFDVDKLEKIVTNLLSNAFKFTPENGRINVRVEAPLPPEGELNTQSKIPPLGVRGLLITVKDTGIGMEAKHLERIFDRFYQAEDGLSPKPHEGTGIGLALVKELVNLLGGTIEVSSELGRGTTFRLTLPFEPIEKLSDSTPPMEQKTPAPVILDVPESVEETKNEHDDRAIMLIVEDNPDLRSYIASIFDPQYQLVLAADGEEGLAKAITFVPDIVISDLMMPKLDGLGFCEKLKNDERINHIPVVMLTAKATLADRLVGLEHGADDYLSKPFNKDELRVRVNNLINQRQKLRQKYANQTIETAAEAPAKKESTIDELFVQKAKKVIDQHLTESAFDVEEFAEGMNLSAVQLRRKLKAITDQTVTEFVRNYRLELAAEMLKKGDKTVSEVAYQVGFDSMPYFSKVFQEKYGKTASEWR